MERTPNASDALVQTLDGLVDGAAVALSGGVAQELGLLENLLPLEIADANGLGTTVDVVTLDDWLLARARRHGYFDCRVGFGEFGKIVLQE